jgi:hypothetical protein
LQRHDGKAVREHKGRNGHDESGNKSQRSRNMEGGRNGSGSLGCTEKRRREGGDFVADGKSIVHKGARDVRNACALLQPHFLHLTEML